MAPHSSSFAEEEELELAEALELVAPAERWLWMHFQSLSNFCHTLVSGTVTEVATPSLQKKKKVDQSFCALVFPDLQLNHLCHQQ